MLSNYNECSKESWMSRRQKRMIVSDKGDITENRSNARQSAGAKLLRSMIGSELNPARFSSVSDAGTMYPLWKQWMNLDPRRICNLRVSETSLQVDLYQKLHCMLVRSEDSAAAAAAGASCHGDCCVMHDEYRVIVFTPFRLLCKVRAVVKSVFFMLSSF